MKKSLQRLAEKKLGRQHVRDRKFSNSHMLEVEAFTNDRRAGKHVIAKSRSFLYM